MYIAVMHDRRDGHSYSPMPVLYNEGLLALISTLRRLASNLDCTLMEQTVDPTDDCFTDPLLEGIAHLRQVYLLIDDETEMPSHEVIIHEL